MNVADWFREERIAVPNEFQSLPFDPADAKAALAQLPQTSAVFALYGAEAHAEPTLAARPTCVRGSPPASAFARASAPVAIGRRVRRIVWQLTGSEFESLLLQFELLQNEYGAKCLERCIWRTGLCPLPGRQCISAHHGDLPAQPARGGLGVWAFCVAGGGGALCRRSAQAVSAASLRGRAGPNPGHPGCVYSEMKMCLRLATRAARISATAKRPRRSRASWPRAGRAGW